MTTDAERNILVVAHAHRDDTVEAAVRVIDALIDGRGSRPCSPPTTSTSSRPRRVPSRPSRPSGSDVSVDDLELAIVLGGDGTILRAAELVRGGPAPVLGINMGHVGFLAEIERDDMDDAVRRVIARDYRVEERLALSVRVKDADGEVIYETWALNEATVEKASRERMLEVVIEIDGRPAVDVRLRRGRHLDADGLDRVQLLRRRPGDLADGRGDRGGAAVGARPVRASRSSSARRPPSRSRCSSAPTASASCGATAAARTSCRPAPASSCGARRSAGASRPPAPRRLHRPAGAQVPPAGRGMARPATSPEELRHHDRRTHVRRARVIEEMRLRDLGVIAEARPADRSRVSRRITGETGAGKTMVVTGLGLLLGQRADSGAVRSGAEQAAVEGVWIVRDAGSRRRPRARGRGRARADRRWARRAVRRPHADQRGSQPGQRRRPRRPAGVLAELATELVVVHGQSDQLRLRSAAAQREALDRFGGAPVRDAARRLPDAVRALARDRAGARPC